MLLGSFKPDLCAYFVEPESYIFIHACVTLQNIARGSEEVIIETTTFGILLVYLRNMYLSITVQCEHEICLSISKTLIFMHYDIGEFTK